MPANGSTPPATTNPAAAKMQTTLALKANGQRVLVAQPTDPPPTDPNGEITPPILCPTVPPPVDSIKKDTVKDPCAEKLLVSVKAANAIIAAQNAQIASYSTSLEYGANQNLSSWPGGTYVSTPVSPGTTSDWTSKFTWMPGNYTTGFSHGHPDGTGPDPRDVMPIVYPITNRDLVAAGPSAVQYYESVASTNIEIHNVGSYIVTINNWTAIQNIIATSYTQQTDKDAFILDYKNIGRTYLINNSTSTVGDASAYALMQKFGSSINVYFAPTGSTTYAPLTTVTDKYGNQTVGKLPCP